MKKIKNQLFGAIAFLFVIAGLSGAAQKFDTSQSEVVSKEEIREFTTYCQFGSDPRAK